MSEIGDRIRRLDCCLADRRRQSGSSDLNGLDKVSLFLALCLVGLSGFFLGLSSSSSGDVVVDSQRDVYHLGEYRVVFQNESGSMVGQSVLGRSNVPGYEDTIFIKEGMGVWQVYKTCGHEFLHVRGVPGGDTESHDWISSVESRFLEPRCLRLVERRFGRDSVEKVRGLLRRNFLAGLDRRFWKRG